MIRLVRSAPTSPITVSLGKRRCEPRRGRRVIMRGCLGQHGPVRPCPIVGLPGSPGSTLQQRRGHLRRRAVGAGPCHRLVLCDRILVTLVVLRLQLSHQALAVLYGVDRATITRAVYEVRPLLAARGFAVPDQPVVRLRTLADVFAYAQAYGGGAVHRRDRDPGQKARSPSRGAAGVRVGQRKQNTIKTTTCSDHAGRTLWTGAVRRGRMHDQTAAKTEGIADLLGQHPSAQVSADEGYRGLATAFPSRSMPRHASLPRTRQPRPWPSTSSCGTGNPPSGSASSMPSSSTSSGGRCSVGLAAGLLRRDLPGRRWTGLRSGSPPVRLTG